MFPFQRGVNISSLLSVGLSPLEVTSKDHDISIDNKSVNKVSLFPLNIKRISGWISVHEYYNKMDLHVLADNCTLLMRRDKYQD